MPRQPTSEFTQVGIRKTTREKLKKFGHKAEFYDDIIIKLMAFYEKHKDEYPEETS